MKVKTIILFVIGAIFVCGIPSYGSFGAAVVGILLAAACFYLGYRSIKKPRRKTTTAASAVTYTPPTPTTPQKEEPFEFLPIKVAGVTFKNGNKSRQSILRALKFRDGEFAEGVDLELKAYEYEGQPAYGIYANGQQIGSVPANMVSYISDNYERIIDFAGIEVYGGGRDKEGNAISYGCEVILKLKKAALTAAQ